MTVIRKTVIGSSEPGRVLPVRRSAPAATFPPGLDVVCLCRMRRDSLPGHSASPPDCAGRTDPPPRPLRQRAPATDELFSSTCAQVAAPGGGVPLARPVAVGTAPMVTPESSAYGAGPLLIGSPAERSGPKWCTPGSTARRSGAEADATDRQATGGPGAGSVRGGRSRGRRWSAAHARRQGRHGDGDGEDGYDRGDTTSRHGNNSGAGHGRRPR